MTAPETAPLADFSVPTLSRAAHDRAAEHRTDEAWLSARWADPSTRVLVVDSASALVDEAGPRPRLVYVSPEEAPGGDPLFLGEVDGSAYFAVAGPLPNRLDASRGRLRDVGALLDDREAGLFVDAVALANWHAAHVKCPRCGAPTVTVCGGHVRRCTADGSEHFPRTDPAVIMVVHDGADRCLLGRQPSWPVGRFSALAGFVEPGESLEQAVAREVLEEVGLHVEECSYVASQPWPFPSSLMLGFHARVSDREIRLTDGEIAEARWFSRDELRAAATSGEVILPSRVSIARLLVARWLGADVEGSW